MGMRLRMSDMGQPRMVMRCSTCHQQIGGPVRDAVRNIDANLFGGMGSMLSVRPVGKSYPNACGRPRTRPHGQGRIAGI